MALSEAVKANFNTIIRAVEAGDVCLLDCEDRRTGQPAPTLCAVDRQSDGTIAFVPFAVLFTENPYDILIPPGGENDPRKLN